MLTKIVGFIIILLLTNISLATTCLANDTACELKQKKLQMMGKLGIEPIKTKDQTAVPIQKQVEQKAPKPPHFQLPKPSSTKTENNAPKPSKLQRNPGLKIFMPSAKDSQAQKATTQDTKAKPTPNTGIYR